MKTIETIFKEELLKIKDQGWIFSTVKGPRAVGRAIEDSFNVRMNNLSIPDFKGQIELKSLRKSKSMSPLTLFSFGKKAWRIPRRELLEKYTYTNKKGRMALYCNAKYSAQGRASGNKKKLFLEISNDKVCFLHEDSTLIANWNIDHIIDQMRRKFSRLAIILVISDIIDGIERFKIDEAILLTEMKQQTIQKYTFINLVKAGQIFIDISMHLKPDGGLRSHGPRFRAIKISIMDEFFNKKELI